MREHAIGTVPAEAWGSTLTVNGTPLIPLIRVVDVRFEPSAA
ncbi:MAG: hypothetical protein U0840_20840 [Gemmataceae bacterium]